MTHWRSSETCFSRWPRFPRLALRCKVRWKKKNTAWGNWRRGSERSKLSGTLCLYQSARHRAASVLRLHQTALQVIENDSPALLLVHWGLLCLEVPSSPAGQHIDRSFLFWLLRAKKRQKGTWINLNLYWKKKTIALLWCESGVLPFLWKGGWVRKKSYFHTLWE